jgi:anti-sigma factor RsiW
MNTRCEQYRLMMPDSISGLLEAKRREKLRRHLDACAECRAQYALLRGDDELLDAFAEAMQGVVARIENATLNALRDEVEAARPHHHL